MPLIGGDSIYRLTDYLDRQAVREKEKRTEKFLTVLPMYLEKQLAGVTDEKTLFSTIPKLSAQMYAFGPQVGQAANQILGNLADVKYKEITIGKQEKQTRDTNIAYSDIVSKIPGVGTAVNELLNRSDIDEEVKSKLLPMVVETNKTKTTGLGMQDAGRYYYQSYDISGSGEQKPGTKFELKKNKEGYGMDVVGTKEVEELPLTMEAMTYLEGELSWKNKLDMQLKKQLAYQVAGYDISEKKKRDVMEDWAKKQLYYDKSDNSQVYLEFDKEGNPSYYKKGKKEIVTSIGKTGFFEDTKTPVTNLSTIEKVTQTPNTEVDQMTSSDIRLETEKANLYARNIGQAMIAAGDAKDADIRDPNTGYFKIDKLIEITEEYPEKYGDIKAEIIKLNLQGAGTLTGDKPTIEKPKW